MLGQVFEEIPNAFCCESITDRLGKGIDYNFTAKVFGCDGIFNYVRICMLIMHFIWREMNNVCFCYSVPCTFKGMPCMSFDFNVFFELQCFKISQKILFGVFLCQFNIGIHLLQPLSLQILLSLWHILPLWSRLALWLFSFYLYALIVNMFFSYCFRIKKEYTRPTMLKSWWSKIYLPEIGWTALSQQTTNATEICHQDIKFLASWSMAIACTDINCCGRISSWDQAILKWMVKSTKPSMMKNVRRNIRKKVLQLLNKTLEKQRLHYQLKD